MLWLISSQYSKKSHPQVSVTCRAITVVTCSSHDVHCICFVLLVDFSDYWPLFVKWISVQHCQVLCKTRYHNIWKLIWWQVFINCSSPAFKSALTYMLSTTKKNTSLYHQMFASFSRWSCEAKHPCHSRCIIKALFLAITIISDRQNFIRSAAIYCRTAESIWTWALSNM